VESAIAATAQNHDQQADRWRRRVTKPGIVLTNLPEKTTLSTGASIGFDLTGVTANAAVYCRLDVYTPIPCPNPFVLGANPGNPLAPGAHTVDYYADTGSGFDVAKPTASYSWTVADATTPPVTGGGTAAATTTPSSSSSSASPLLLASINAGQPFASMGNHSVQALGRSHAITTVSETTGIQGADAITGPSTLGASRMRFGKIPDPLNPSRQVFYHAAKYNDGQTFFHYGRVDIQFDSVAGAIQKSGLTYWIAFEHYIPSSVLSGAAANFMDIHNSTPPSTVFGPFALMADSSGRIYPNAGVMVNTAWSSQSDPSQAGYNDNERYPWASNNAGNSGQTFGAYPTDQWVKWVFKYRGDPTGGTGSLQGWMTYGGNTHLVVNMSGVNLGTTPQGYPTDYLKLGFDQYGDGGGTSGRWILLRSGYLFQDNGNTEPQIIALMQ
jgi:hypothetical protein